MKSFLQKALRSPTVRTFGIATLVALLAGFLALINATRLVPMAFQWMRSNAAPAFGGLALLLLVVTLAVGAWHGLRKQPDVQPGDPPDVDPGGEGAAGGLPSGLAPTIALVVAGLAAVGITGDYLPRMVRDEPNWVRVILIGALIGAAIIAIAAVRRGTRKGPPKTAWLGLAGALVVVAATGGAVILGSVSVSRREQPRVVVTAETAANGTVVIDVAVNGSGLRPRDDMLVQIIGLKEFAGTIVDDEPLCETSQRETPIADEKGEMLAWERLGPDTKGNVEGTVKVEVAAGAFQGVCAYGAFAPEGEKATGGSTNDESAGDKVNAETTNLNTARDTTSYLRLEPPAAAEPATATTTATTATTNAPPPTRAAPATPVCPRHSRAGGA